MSSSSSSSASTPVYARTRVSATVSLIEDEEPMAVSDLVRTAEASRLRRRGAIHNRAASLGTAPSVPASVIPGSSTTTTDAHIPVLPRPRQMVPSSDPINVELEAYRTYLSSLNIPGTVPTVSTNPRSRSRGRNGNANTNSGSRPGSTSTVERREYARVRAPLSQIAVPPPPQAAWADLNPDGGWPSWADSIVTGAPVEPKPEDEMEGVNGAAGVRYELRCGAEMGELVAVDDSDSDMSSATDSDSDSDLDSSSSSDSDSDDAYGRSSYSPSVLPLWPSGSTSRSRGYRSNNTRSRRHDGPRRMVRKSTGCGALVHVSAAPKVSNGTWVARGNATGTVIPLAQAFFERGRGGNVKQFACGCRWFGVGCSECGNALGNIYIPCQAATSTPPSGARTGRTARSGSSSGVNGTPGIHHVYTFFSDAVTPTPSFTFPPSKSKRRHESTAHAGTTSFALGSGSASGSGASTRAQTPAPEFGRFDAEDNSMQAYPNTNPTSSVIPVSMNFDADMDYIRVSNESGNDAVMQSGDLGLSRGVSSSLRVYPGDSSGVVYDADGMPSLGRRRVRGAVAGTGIESGNGIGIGSSDEEVTRNGNVNRDPDGERIGDEDGSGGIAMDDEEGEPGSPDKYSAEALMSPAR